jgi:ubiquinone/menaquinone biosynthesis C-methylase UbiE
VTGSAAGDAALKAGQADNFDNLNDVVAGSPYDKHLRFFNFGYRPLEGDPVAGPSISPAFPNRDSAQLLFEVVGDADLTGATVAEIGCGRGGNLWLLRRYYGTAQVVGVDIAYKSIVFCRSSMPDDDASFVHGDAEQVPLASGFADAVVSVETSCTYPDIESFFRNVARVLKVGGRFLYTDLIDHELMPAFIGCLEALGLRLDFQRDITKNVAASRAARAARQKLAFGERGDEDQGAMSEFVGEDGSELFDYLSGVDRSYTILRFTKTADVDAPAERFLSTEQQELVRKHAAEAVDLLTIPSATPAG